MPKARKTSSKGAPIREDRTPAKIEKVIRPAETRMIWLAKSIQSHQCSCGSCRLHVHCGQSEQKSLESLKMRLCQCTTRRRGFPHQSAENGAFLSFSFRRPCSSSEW